VHLLTVLLLSDLGCTLLVLVRLHNRILKSLKLIGSRADALDFLLSSLVGDLESGHFTGEVVLDLGGGVEVGSEGSGSHNGLF